MLLLSCDPLEEFDTVGGIKLNIPPEFGVMVLPGGTLNTPPESGGIVLPGGKGPGLRSELHHWQLTETQNIPRLI